MTHHHQELPITFHIKRKFFKVMKRGRGGISVSKATTKTQFKVSFSDEETFWLARIYHSISEVGEKAHKETLRRNGSTVV
ncbi:hypothetical protein Scep_023867 [Stephania cephalantha]|uniref:Uncharacterized protein n=1 Tax=Stephania cephalantha TaxID=152367 RepID=A0AAP0HWM5_9MAGN